MKNKKCPIKRKKCMGNECMWHAANGTCAVTGVLTKLSKAQSDEPRRSRKRGPGSVLEIR